MEAQDESHDINTGKMFSSLEQNKERGDASCFFSVVTVLAQFRAVPVHGYLVIIWGDISVQAGAGAGGAGKFPGKALYCDPSTPLSTTHTTFLRAEAITNFS